MAENVLTLIVFSPLAGMLAVLLLPSDRYNLIRWVSALFTLPPLLLSVWLFVNFDRSEPGLQFIQKVPWIPEYNIDYFVAVDGLSIAMVILSALLCFICIFASWGIEKGVKGYFALFLLLETGMAGVFKTGIIQAHGEMATEPTFDPDHVAQAVVYMAGLPLDTNVQFMTVIATKMPYIGRG